MTAYWTENGHSFFCRISRGFGRPIHLSLSQLPTQAVDFLLKILIGFLFPARRPGFVIRFPPGVNQTIANAHFAGYGHDGFTIGN